MPKNTVLDGPSNAAVDVEVDEETGRQPLEVQHATDLTGLPEEPLLTEDEQADLAQSQNTPNRGFLSELRAAIRGEGDEPSASHRAPEDGTDSSASTEKPPTLSSPAPTSSDTPAPTTESHSGPVPTEAGTAPSTATVSTPQPVPPT